MLTFEGRHQWAALALFIGMVLDMLDGKVARLTRTTTQFGVEFDSLADVISFGVGPGAPPLLVGAPAARPRRGGAAFLYVICAALRCALQCADWGDGPPLLHRPAESGSGGRVAAAILFEGRTSGGRRSSWWRARRTSSRS